MTEQQTTADRRRVPRCPGCGRPRVHEYRPFCSARCRDVDLGRWFTGAYAVPAIEDDDASEELSELLDRRPEEG